MPANGFNMRQHWMLPLVLAPRVLSQGLPTAKVVVANIEHFQSLQAGPFQPLLRMGFGEPLQSIVGIFDTGSSDIIVPQAGSTVCKLPNQQCRKAPIVLGDFEPAKSSDVKEVNNSTLNATFDGGDGFDGPFLKTAVSFGDIKVVDVQVGLAVNGSLPGDFPQFPVFGVGPQEGEQTENKYVNMVARMKKAGVIGSNVMGVGLNRTAFGNGSVVFGGVDKARYKGELKEVPIDPAENGKILDFVVNMTSIRLQLNDRPPNQGQKGQKGKKDQRGKKGKKCKKGKQDQQGQQVRRSHYGRALPRPGGESYGRHGLSTKEDNNGKNNGGNGDRRGKGGDRDGRGDKNKNGGENGNGNKGNDKNGQKGKNNNNNNNNGNGNGNGNGNQNNNGIIDLGLKPEEKFTVIDTGGVIIQLPRDSVEAMAKALGTRTRRGELDFVDCAVVSDNNKLLFGFNDDNTIVSVPLSHAQISNSVLTARDRASGKCKLGIGSVAPDSNLNSMGYPWGSAVYTVFDLDKNRLLFAEAVENPTQPDIQPFP